MRSERAVHVADIDFNFSCEVDEPAAVDIELKVESLPDLSDSYLIRGSVREKSGAAFVLRDLMISWSVPVVDMHGLYFGGNPGPHDLAWLPFWERDKRTAAQTGVPYMALIHRGGENRAAFGLLDQVTETDLHADLSEATRAYQFTVHKPYRKPGAKGGLRVSGQWEENLFVSTAHHPWPEVLKKYVAVTDKIIPTPKMPVPDHAFDPVFDSWTAIHHDVSHEWVMRNAKLAADLGFKTWITDDGWFIESGQFANYRLVGSWEPYTPKFPDFAAHVRAVQDLGFRYVLWVSPFMVGNDSKAAKTLAPLLTTGVERLEFKNLAPWKPETQTVIGELMTRLVRDYHLDGLKVDFIDAVSVDGELHDSIADTTIGQSIYTTLKNATDHVREFKPDVLIEYRNSYTNLASRSYANVYRSSDVPINFSLNRWQATLVRLLAPDRAAHLDPALWHPSDTDENVAVHLINCLISVPMIGIQLDEYPKSHLDLIRNWIGFYNAHRDTIIHGDFRPIMGLGYIPETAFVGSSEMIISLYEDAPITTEPRKTKVWILNASTRPYIELESAGWTDDWEITARDKYGKVTSQQKVQFPVAQLSVEVGGSLEMTPC